MAANSIHPTAVIGDDVSLGTGNVIGAYAVLEGPLEMGDDNWIAPHCCIGTPGEQSGTQGGEMATFVRRGVQIGSRNVIREFATVQQGFDGPTRIGNECYIMTKAHVPHDGQVMDNVTVTCGVLLGGHSQVGWRANLGLGTVVHQKRVVGPFAMIGMQSVITSDVPPAAIAFGAPARVRGANRVGLERAGFSPDDIEAIDRAYRGDGRTDDVAALAEALRWFHERVASAAP